MGDSVRRPNTPDEVARALWEYRHYLSRVDELHGAETWVAEVARMLRLARKGLKVTPDMDLVRADEGG